MEKTELGFQAELQLCEGETFNFCFRNSNGQWDNNDGQNYVFQLENLRLNLIVLEDEPSSIRAPRKHRKVLFVE